VIAKAWLETLAMMAAQGTLLALVALAITRLGKLRPPWQAAIWLVVVAKLAVPWGPAMPWSLSDLLAGFAHHPEADPNAYLPPALRPLPAAPSVWIGWSVLAGLWALGAGIVLARALVAHGRAVRAAAARRSRPRICARCIRAS